MSEIKLVLRVDVFNTPENLFKKNGKVRAKHVEELVSLTKKAVGVPIVVHVKIHKHGSVKESRFASVLYENGTSGEFSVVCTWNIPSTREDALLKADALAENATNDGERVRIMSNAFDSTSLQDFLPREQQEIEAEIKQQISGALLRKCGVKPKYTSLLVYALSLPLGEYNKYFKGVQERIDAIRKRVS